MAIRKLFTQLSTLLKKGAQASSQSGNFRDGSSSGIFHQIAEPFRRKHMRVKLFPLHSVSFELVGWPKKTDLGNLSISGMGIFTESLPPGIKANDLLEGVLVCGGAQAKVTARVVHVGNTMTGCQFVGHDSEVNRLVQSYFNLELSALTMISVRPELLQEDPDGTPHWIHGKNNCELFYISRGEQVVRFNLTFFGNYIEGGAEMRAKYGQIVEDDDGAGKPRHKASALVRWDASLASQLEAYAVRFLASIPHLEDAHRKELSRMLKQSS